jgi:hypothetical protein
VARLLIQETIEYLRGVNSAHGPIDTYALGEEAEANRTGDLDERFAAIQLALISNLIETVRAANDHLSVGLEVNRLMWFYGMGLSPDREFWAQKYKEHGAMMRVGFDEATASINLATELIDKEIEGVQECQEGLLRDEWIKALMACVEKLNGEQARLAPAVLAYQNIDDRAQNRGAHYEEHQKPIFNGFDVKGYFEALHREGFAGAAEDVTKANINVAQTFLVRASFIEQTVIPNRPNEEADPLLRNVLKMKVNIGGALDRAETWRNIQILAEGFSYPKP